MKSPGFTNAPVSRFLVFSTVAGALLATITDSKYYMPILVAPHIWSYGQFWRVFTWQLCFTNSTEVLLGVVTFYQLRVVERLWGSRKFASFLIYVFPYTMLISPFLLIFALRPLTFGRMNYLPAGPSSLLFALLANYYAAIPYTYRYKVSACAPPNSQSQSNVQASTSLWSRSVTLTSKSLSYIPPIQLAFCQFPGSLLAAAIGWVIGTAYRRDLLPGAQRWRVPGWMVGEEEKKGYEGLRARLDAERERDSAAGLATGVHARGARQARQRRTFGDMVAEQFRLRR